MNRFARLGDVAQKAWKYVLAAVERPQQVSRLLYSILNGVHVADFLNVNQRWIKHAGIRTVIDIGAHTGEFWSAVRAVLPGVCVYAFEPLPECFQELVARFDKCPHSRAFQVALGERRGRVTFWRSSFSKSSSVLRMAALHQKAFPWSANCSPVEVRLETLDDYLSEMELTPKVLLKIDAQGYEDRVLQGGALVLKQVEYVLVEVSFRPLYEGQATFHRVYELLLKSGFAYAGSLDQLLSPVDDAALQADALFVRQS
jgi:FkbM family methyltransferase